MHSESMAMFTYFGQLMKNCLPLLLVDHMYNCTSILWAPGVLIRTSWIRIQAPRIWIQSNSNPHLFYTGWMPFNTDSRLAFSGCWPTYYDIRYVKNIRYVGQSNISVYRYAIPISNAWCNKVNYNSDQSKKLVCLSVIDGCFVISHI